MTLIIGILCTDGVVLGADTQATYAALGQRTIRQEGVGKLQVICGDKAILGVSGPVGLGQRIAAEIERMYGANEIPANPVDAMTAIRGPLWNKHIGIEMQVAGVARNAIGQLAVESAVCTSLLAMPIGNEPCLYWFDQNGAPELAKDNILFYSIGSGQTSADPFLAFLRRTFWKNRKPDISDGVFTALWALQYVIQSDPGGVGGTPRIAVLERKNGPWMARHMEDPELEEHKQIVASAQVHLAGFARPSGAADIPKPGGAPPPPPM